MTRNGRPSQWRQIIIPIGKKWARRERAELERALAISRARERGRKDLAELLAIGAGDAFFRLHGRRWLAVNGDEAPYKRTAPTEGACRGQVFPSFPRRASREERDGHQRQARAESS